MLRILFCAVTLFASITTAYAANGEEADPFPCVGCARDGFTWQNRQKPRSAPGCDYRRHSVRICKHGVCRVVEARPPRHCG